MALAWSNKLLIKLSLRIGRLPKGFSRKYQLSTVSSQFQQLPLERMLESTKRKQAFLGSMQLVASKTIRLYQGKEILK
jgi:hypothetical protein